jgi:hypothetical protein
MVVIRSRDGLAPARAGPPWIMGLVTGRASGASPTLPALAEVEVVPASPVRVPHRGTDGTTRGTDDGVVRLVHLGPDRPAILEVRALGGGRLLLRASGRTPRDAEEGLERARFWSWVDDDLSPFLERFAEDELIGASVREAPWLRPFRRPLPFEVLMGAVCEQLITDERAQEIKRRIAATHGLRREGLLDTPGPTWSPPGPGRARRVRAGPEAGADPARRRARGRRGDASTSSTASATRRAGGVCARSRASGRGRSASWPSTARATSTRCRRATTPTASSSRATAGCRPAPRPSPPRSWTSSARTRAGAGWRAGTCCGRLAGRRGRRRGRAADPGVLAGPV